MTPSQAPGLRIAMGCSAFSRAHLNVVAQHLSADFGGSSPILGMRYASARSPAPQPVLRTHTPVGVFSRTSPISSRHAPPAHTRRSRHTKDISRRPTRARPCRPPSRESPPRRTRRVSNKLPQGIAHTHPSGRPKSTASRPQRVDVATVHRSAPRRDAGPTALVGIARNVWLRCP